MGIYERLFFCWALLSLAVFFAVLLEKERFIEEDSEWYYGKRRKSRFDKFADRVSRYLIVPPLVILAVLVWFI